MPYLIDGNNLCGAGRDRRLHLPTGEPEMVAVLADFATRRSGALTVVFDGPAGPGRSPGRPGRVRVVHSGPRRTADDVIVDLAERSRTPADITVVTSDRELRDRVRALGCHVPGCRRFAEIIQRAPSPPGNDKPDRVDLDDWERYFAGDD